MRLSFIGTLLAVLMVTTTTVSANDTQSKRIKQWFDSVMHISVIDLTPPQPDNQQLMTQVHHLPHTSADDIMSAVADYQDSMSLDSAPLHFPHKHQYTGGDDYPDCGKTVEETAEHLVNATLDFFYNKICKDTKVDYVKKICKFAEEHEELFEGFVVGYTDPYTKSFFYAAGAGKCDPHAHPFNMTGDRVSMSFIDIYADIDDMYSSDIQAYVYRDDTSSCPHHATDDDDDISNAIEALLSDISSGDDKDKCEKCYMKVVMKYIKKVEEIGEKYCAKTQCPYLQKLCAYLDEHKEFKTGLIAGIFKPFKFAAGFCIGNKSCKHDHSNYQMSIMTVLDQYTQ